MINLDNDPQKNEICALELERAKIPVLYTDNRVYGNLFNVFFSRRSHYWWADGFVNLKIAEEIYADPVGRTDIRCGGHVLGLPPSEYGMWGINKDGFLTDEKDSKYAVDFVSYVGYDIDSEVGLRVFADFLRKYENIILELNQDLRYVTKKS